MKESKGNKTDPMQVYLRWRNHWGPQQWWPANSPFEVLVGAILTQNTAWSNVEKAIENLRQADCLTEQSLADLDHETLAQLIRPSGYYRLKATRLHHAIRFVQQHGGMQGLANKETNWLRSALLTVYGIGPETADSILLYAFLRPVFVVDAYTRRIFSRLGWLDAKAPYEDIRMFFERRLDLDTSLFNDYHAQVVKHAKQFCRVRPYCQNCILQDICQAFRDKTQQMPVEQKDSP